MPVQRINTPDGISWHVESFSPTHSATIPEYLVLIPSGEGDCQSLLTVAHNLSTTSPGYHVLTFDMPGMSRTTAPPSATAQVTAQLLSTQIITLLDALSIPRASFFGCSSGGATTLALTALYPSRVKCGIVHEVPFFGPPPLHAMKSLSDTEISTACQGLFANAFLEQTENDGRAKWDALGEDYHARLAKNFPVWIHGYVGCIEHDIMDIVSVPGSLTKRPIFWTVGGLNPGSEEGKGVWEANFQVARENGLRVESERLRCLHFPSVTVPEDLVRWIRDCVGSVEG